MKPSLFSPKSALLSLSLITAVAAGAVGCSSAPASSSAAGYPAGTYGATYGSTATAAYGRVESIEYVRGAGGASGTGAVVGGLVGGLLGNQVGGGTGRTAATVAGAVGGAVVGNKIEEKRQGATDMYQIGVRLDNGSYVTILQDSAVDLRVGNRVTIQNNRVYRY